MAEEPSKDMAYFVAELKEDMVTPAAREVYENYSKISPADVISHIQEFRNKAFKVYPYPCLALFSFLDLALPHTPSYASILTRMQSGATFLDLGCCVAQDLRKLVYDGAPSKNTYGSDLQADFMNIGYDLFLDKDTLGTTFIAADIFDESEKSGLKALEGKVDIIHAAFFFHLWDWEKQLEATRRVVKLFRDQKGCLLVGRQLGNVEAVEPGALKGKFRHDPKSFKKMWRIVGKETGTEWRVDAKLGDEDLYERAKKRGGKVSFLPPGSRVLNFEVERIK